MKTRRLPALITMLCAAGGFTPAQAQDTFAVVTQAGGNAYLTQPGGKPSLLSSPGMGFLRGQEILLDEGAQVRLTDRQGHRYLVVGPAHVTATHDALDVTRGAVAVTAMPGVPGARLQSAGLAGESTGVAALWVDGAKAQWLSVTGASSTWHPRHRDVTVAVMAGNYTESSLGREYLEPRAPRQPDQGLAADFLNVFGERLAALAAHSAASVPHGAEVVHGVADGHGSRSAASVPMAAKATAKKHRNEVYAALEPGTEPDDARGRGTPTPAANHSPARALASEKKPTPAAPPISRAELLERLAAHVEGRSFNEDDYRNKLSKAQEEAKKRRLAEITRRKALTGKREASFRQAMGDHGVTVRERKPASLPEVKVKAVGEAGYEDEDELMKRTGLIDRLIKDKDPKH